jgi:hypothetical protein
MSLEDAVFQLASAVSRNQQGAAVAEIIRQRDAWQAQSVRDARDAKFYEERRNEYWKELQHHICVNSSLRGVITRMKKQRSKPESE